MKIIMNAVSCPLMLKSTVLASSPNSPTSTVIESAWNPLLRAMWNSIVPAPASSPQLKIRNNHNTSSSERLPVTMPSTAGISTFSGDVKTWTLSPTV